MGSSTADRRHERWRQRGLGGRDGRCVGRRRRVACRRPAHRVARPRRSEQRGLAGCIAADEVPAAVRAGADGVTVRRRVEPERWTAGTLVRRLGRKRQSRSLGRRRPGLPGLTGLAELRFQLGWDHDDLHHAARGPGRRRQRRRRAVPPGQWLPWRRHAAGDDDHLAPGWRHSAGRRRRAVGPCDRGCAGRAHRAPAFRVNHPAGDRVDQIGSDACQGDDADHAGHDHTRRHDHADHDSDDPAEAPLDHQPQLVADSGLEPSLGHRRAARH
jgi:hypothetical protein